MISIKKSDMPGAMAKARETYTLAGPVKDKEGHVFRQLGNGEIPDLTYEQTRMSPKSLVFPQLDPMFSYSLDHQTNPGSLLNEFSQDKQLRAAVGIRPYDAKALAMLKMNFDTPEYTDPYFIRKNEPLTLIGLAENFPNKTNFSTSCGTGPFDETHLDMILADTGDAFLGKILTPKGDAFARAAGFTLADPGAEELFEKLKSTAEESISSQVIFDHIQAAETLELYDAPFWEEAAFSCINCSTCTFVCPTCWCFDIQDETAGSKGVRLRLWDSCMSDLYSAHASGHNPRAEGWKRFRNRFMHKLKYFPDKYGQGIMCVGCGRCVSACPVNIDIRNIIKALNSPLNCRSNNGEVLR
ncbi:MAG: 4Fe-4S dicluster domain-containing protein [Proteobacteria bacterium]|nr:4Fe-4S dicluster domain-containing protein [Pseudomonadota bacterium]